MNKLYIPPAIEICRFNEDVILISSYDNYKDDFFDKP